MKARGHWTIAALFVVGSMTPAAAQIGGGGGVGSGGLGGSGRGGIGGTGPIGSPVGRDSIGGIVRPGDMGATGPGLSGGLGNTGSGFGGSGLGGSSLRSGNLGSNSLGGSAPLTGREPGGAPGSGGANRSGNAAYNPQADLGINDPFAAAGTGIGGPAPDDIGIGSVNEALSQSPNARPGLVNPSNVPPSAMSPGGNALDPLSGSTGGVGGIGGVGAAGGNGAGQPY